MQDAGIMITRRLLFLALLVHVARCWKNCNDIPFCTKFRNYDATGSDQFTANLDQVQHDKTKNIMTVPLSNGNNVKLNMELSFLMNLTLRVKILETENKRYEIQDVLDHEPQTLQYDVVEGESDSLVIKVHEQEDVSLLIKKGAPFSMEFVYKGQTQSVFDSSQLVFDNCEDGPAFSFKVVFQGATHMYGLHHHADILTLRDTTDMSPYRFYNVDNGGYRTNSTDPLYGAVPVVYGHSKERTTGIFLQNAAQQFIEIKYKESEASAHFMVGGGTLDLFVFYGPTFKDVVQQYVALTGRPHLPQIWTLGYHQCRYSYQTQDVVKEVATKMEENNFPVDAIWLDIDYTDGKKYFTWHPDNFPDPVGMQKYLASMNKRLVTIIDPHIKVDPEYPVYAGAKGKYFVKMADGSDFEGDCWPGRSSYIDFLNPEARDYIANWYQYEMFNGSTPTLAGFWNDMNEPSVFNAGQWENSLPPDSLHYGDVKHRDIHNMYGFLQTKATHQGLMTRDKKQKRPFVLTRSHFAGSQRYAAIWTGDNCGDWAHLQVTYSECMLSNIVGHVFCGADIGGFLWNPETELVQRWYQAGVWLPFYRGHSNADTNRREPYVFEPEVQEVIRTAIQTRYRHLPVFYTMFYKHVSTGEPVVRPLFYEYPEMTDIDDHILIGRDILAAPVMEKEVQTKTVHFPGDENTYWYRADQTVGDWTVHKGGTTETFNVDIKTSLYFYRAGSIVVVTNENRTSTNGILEDAFTVHVNADVKGEAIGYHYSDDGESFQYQDNEDFALFELKYQPGSSEVHAERIEGKKDVKWHIILSVCAASLHAVDHNIFKTCDKVGVCSRLRSNAKSDQFQIGDLTKYTLDKNNEAITWEVSKNKDKFKLTIQLLEGAKVRLQLEETDKVRYKLKGVLDPQNRPKPLKITPRAVKDGKQITIEPVDSKNEKHTVIVYNNPLNVAFLHDGKELVALDGTHLVMDHKTEDKTEIKDIGFVVQFNEADKLYGLHHHAYDLELPDTTVKTEDGKYKSDPFRLRNSDTAGFEANSPMALYGSVPVVYGHSKKSTAGIFLHNAAEQWVDVHYEKNGSPSTHFMVDSGSFDLFVMLGPNIEKVVQQFTDLTGKAHMPQVLEVLKQMKQNNFPLDAIWLDIDYTDNKKYFTWNKNFTGSDGKGVETMLATLGADGRKLVTIIDPHIKKEDGYVVYDEGKKGKLFVQDKKGVDFVAAREYYANHYSDQEFHHGHPEVLAGIWNDMNEPSVFNDNQEKTMPFEMMHKSDKDSETFDVEHRDIHNIYGFLHTMSTHMGLLKRDKIDDPIKKAKRPFILTRSHFAGSQRYAAMWTGDNTPDWAHLKNSYSECMLSNLVGHVFCGADIPGFFKDPVPSEEFVYRAYQAGIWFPFFRGHTSEDSEPREPYRYKSTTQELIRHAMKMRYRHIPTWYRLFYEHTQTGAPVIRPLFYNFPGDDILARPVFEEGAKTVKVHLPGKDEYWYRIDNGYTAEAYQGGQDITVDVSNGESPVFYRGGSIVVTRDRDVTSTAEGEKYPVTVYINLNKKSNYYMPICGSLRIQCCKLNGNSFSEVDVVKALRNDENKLLYKLRR
ncbi:unnamed protein product [Callosobruchus maculatus]|uniref:Glucosidase II subunit alpha n=1 Tax=Callosobruchus maculatus TaxID=64391 RepID=A0A653BDN3_CALMS|nr:unnamed protein product [Callosobruchus maculatus]